MQRCYQAGAVAELQPLLLPGLYLLGGLEALGQQLWVGN